MPKSSSHRCRGAGDPRVHLRHRPLALQPDGREAPRQSIGHEAIGIVEAVGQDVHTLEVSDLVIMPFANSDGTCVFCQEHLHTACVHVQFFGHNGLNGAQAEALRIPYADGTLYPINLGPDDALMPSLLTL